MYHLSPVSSFTALLSIVSLVCAHTVITYPGWRGDNLISNCTIGVDDYSTGCFPYGMQWMYPCGGMGISRNRTYWPLNGGAIAFQPGWFSGHETAFLYVNMGLGTIPPNYSHPLLPVFEITGPTNNEYPSLDVCLPQVPLPANITVNVGDNATLQIVEAAKHGAALFSCVDITFTNDMSLVKEVNASNCINATQIEFSLVFTTKGLTSGGLRSRTGLRRAGWVAIATSIVLAWSWLP